MRCAVGLFLALVVAACNTGGGLTTPSTTPTLTVVRDADMSGRWHGWITLSASDQDTAYISLTLTQSGTAVEGTFECLYRCVEPIGTVTGTVSGMTLTWRLAFPNGGSCDGFEGTVFPDGVSGRYACAGAIGTDGTASGSWDLSRQSLSQCVPELVSPVANAILDNGRIDRSDVISWDFDWTDCPGATYHLVVIGRTAIYPVVDDWGLVESTSRMIDCGSYIGGSNVYGWRWRVRAYIDGRSGEWSREGIFDVEGPDSDPPQACE